MAEASIPVDLINPGQVFACLGFMEAAEVLCGNAEGAFDWTGGTRARFLLRAGGESNPFEAVLEFLAEAEPVRWGPIGYTDPPPEKGEAGESEDAAEDEQFEESAAAGPAASLELSIVFPARKGGKMELPIRFGGGNRPVVELDHWADGTSRNSFKLYSGNRSAETIARAMLKGPRTRKPGKRASNGRSASDAAKGVRQLWESDRAALIEAPFDVLVPMGGSFNLDPRGAWTAIDAGYSPNDHKHPTLASPVVEFLSVWGLQNARPVELEHRRVRYMVWGVALPPMLARAALADCIAGIPSRRFRFELDLSGKNKIVTFAREEVRS